MEGEVDGIGGINTRILSQLLTELDGIVQLHGVIVFAATNRVDIIDPALLRPGRFDKIVFVPKPDRIIRQRILEIYTKRKPLSHDVDLNKISDSTEGFSGADISAIANTAISLVLHEYLQRYSTPEEAAKRVSDVFISGRHFEEAVYKIKTQREMKSKRGIGPSQYM